MSFNDEISKKNIQKVETIEMVKVVKFGGSSLASSQQFKKVGEIIHAEESRKYIVPSAPGKRFSDDIKVTDMLYECYTAAVKGKDYKPLLENVLIVSLGIEP